MKARSLVTVLSAALILSPLHVRAEDPVAPAAAPALASQDGLSAEDAWRKELNEARQSQSRTKTAGIVTSLTAVTLVVVGDVRAASAVDVGGCKQDGSDIKCDSQSGHDEAQSRLDQGRAAILVGAVTGLIGIGLLIRSSEKRDKIEGLEQQGREAGYRLTLVPSGRDGAQLVLFRNF